MILDQPPWLDHVGVMAVSYVSALTRGVHDLGGGETRKVDNLAHRRDKGCFERLVRVPVRRDDLLHASSDGDRSTVEDALDQAYPRFAEGLVPEEGSMDTSPSPLYRVPSQRPDPCLHSLFQRPCKDVVPA